MWIGAHSVVDECFRVHGQGSLDLAGLLVHNGRAATATAKDVLNVRALRAKANVRPRSPKQACLTRQVSGLAHSQLSDLC